MNNKKQYLKYGIIALGIVLLVAVALLAVKVWEKRQGQFEGEASASGVLTYEGERYVLRDDLETFLVMGLDKYEGDAVSDSHGTGVQADFLMLFVIRCVHFLLVVFLQNLIV